MMAETICRIKNTGLMGIVRVDTIERGIEIAQGCLDGGVDVLEISYTNNNAGEVIKALDVYKRQAMECSPNGTSS